MLLLPRKPTKRSWVASLLIFARKPCPFPPQFVPYWLLMVGNVVEYVTPAK